VPVRWVIPAIFGFRVGLRFGLLPEFVPILGEIESADDVLLGSLFRQVGQLFSYAVDR
jgi:hypothetical protein